eukprot:5638567-Pleurochrysis_carterae.AAC.1
MAATSDSQRQGCLICAAAASPRTSRRSVAPRMRQHFPPKSPASRPRRAAYCFASARESSESHALAPLSFVNSGELLGRPKARSASGTSCRRSSYMRRMA